MIPTTPGIWRADAETYHANTRISNSKLKAFKESIPTFYRQFVTKEVEQKTTPAMQLGTFLHTLVLEPEKADIYVCAPDCGKKLKADKARHDEFAEQNEGKIILDYADYQNGIAMRDSILAHPLASAWIDEAGWNETNIVWDHKTGIGMRARLDGWRPESHIIFDIKTTKEPDAESFNSRALTQLGYHRQAALYIDGAIEALNADPDKVKFYFIAVCSTTQETYVVGLHPNLLELAREENDALLQELSECRFADDWSSRSANYEVPLLPGPAWAYNREPFERVVFQVAT